MDKPIVSNVENQQALEEEHLSHMLSLFSRVGFKSVTMDDIARELGMSKKTLYTLIEDKTDLISKVIEYELRIGRQYMEGTTGEEMHPIDELMEVNRRIHSYRQRLNPSFFYDLKKYYPRMFRQWMEEKRKRMADLIVRNMDRGIQDGVYRHDMDTSMIARIYMLRSELLFEEEILSLDAPDMQKFLREVFLYHLHGICSSKGLHYLQKQNHTI
jgi:AcrR family transcriptional regulator